MVRRVSATDVRTGLGAILEQVVQGAHIEIERLGEPVAVILPVADYQHLQSLRAAADGNDALSRAFDVSDLIVAERGRVPYDAAALVQDGREARDAELLDRR